MTFSILVPSTINDAWFDASNVTEADFTAWSAGASYSVGDKVMVAGTTHRNFECIQDHTPSKPPTVAANVGVGKYWLDMGATNRWKPFDLNLSSPCTNAGNINFRLLAQAACTAIAMFGVTGGSAAVIHYSPVGGRTNLQTYSDEFGNAAHTAPNGAALIGNTEQDPYGAYQADVLQEDGTTGVHEQTLSPATFASGSPYTHSIHVKRRPLLGNRDVRLQLPAAAFGTAYVATFNLGTGATSGVTPGATAAVTGPDAFGYYRISISATATANATASPKIQLSNGGVSYTGNSVAGIHMFGTQVNLGATPSTYQWIRDAAKYGTYVSSQYKNLSVILNGNSATAIFSGFTIASGDYVAFSVQAASGNSQIGEFAAGITYGFGETISGVGVGILDYSSKVIDTYGNASVVRRSFAKTADYQVWVDRGEVSKLQEFLAYLRGVPVVFYDTQNTGDWGTTVYGFYKEFSFSVIAAQKSMMMLRAEGLV